MTGSGPASSAAEGRLSAAPPPGSAVTLVPALDARLLTGVLLWWEAPEGSEVDDRVGLGVDIAPSRARSPEVPVWATVNAPGGDILVLSAVAHGDGETTVTLDGRVAVREPRRRNVRAAAHVDVDLTLGGASNRVTGRTLDLSAGGCRIALESGDEPLPHVVAGEPTDIVIHLDQQNRPHMMGHVHAVRPGGQLVIRFDEVPSTVVEQIERYVYATLP
ncbi:PilZ domain-containing protein [Motilibacter rhizosphaerae]|uniref:PilZ domain-containing protein n=1 Tax=Motilibacter rhizosphaerae TaxID=598652 RepID=A0A4Q7NFU6_9ACTN|nr:PilZ domain-containing protein [Motilibacter rhizosphaerae]RZS82770.1 PilZ domain-containing protein [Motilibacter rhizosphaerae]